MEFDEEIGLQSSGEEFDVGEDRSDMKDGMESKEDKDITSGWMVLEQALAARNNGEASTASTAVGAAGRSAIGSVAGSSDGGSTFRKDGDSAGSATGSA